MRRLRHRQVALIAGALALGAGCQRVDAGSYERDPKPPAPPSDGDEGLPPWFDTGPAEEDATGETVQPETGFQPTGTDGEGMCPKVDILFVIDDSFSMGEEQENLANSYAGFVQGIEDALGDANDYHLGVVTTDAYDFNPSECSELGDLVTMTPAGACGPYARGPFMSADDDLDAVFPCAANVGTDGDPDERPMAAALAALEPGRQLPGACNEGFAREDALLILVVITDEDDVAGSGSLGTPEQWYETVVTSRGGYESNVVVLSIIGVTPPNACEVSLADPGVRIADFTQRFTYSGIADVCEEDYAPFLAEALNLVYAACSGFTPPG